LGVRGGRRGRGGWGGGGGGGNGVGSESRHGLGWFVLVRPVGLARRRHGWAGRHDPVWLVTRWLGQSDWRGGAGFGWGSRRGMVGGGMDETSQRGVGWGDKARSVKNESPQRPQNPGNGAGWPWIPDTPVAGILEASGGLSRETTYAPVK